LTTYLNRFTKSGCAFFTKKHAYMRILADEAFISPMVAAHSPSQSGLIERQSTKVGATHGCVDKPETGVW